MRPPSMPLDRMLAACGIVGVVGFVAAWAIGGRLVDGYSGIDDAISQLAAVDSSARALMSAGFVAFGIGVPLFAQALRTALGGPAWIAATVTGLATLGVAVTPLGRFDAAHYVFAAGGYASLAATPLLAAVTLRRRGATRRANLSIACGAVSAALLAASTLDPVHGLTQRLGLGVTDAWIVATAVVIIRQTRRPTGGHVTQTA
ncbi:MAG: DUF998 domain-containing protein [Microthrixaceae bacterium]